MKVIVLGITGMLGNAMFRFLAANHSLEVYGTARHAHAKRFFSSEMQDRIVTGVDVESQDSLIKVFDKVRPQVIINCVGLVKQLAESADPLQAVPINTLLPHRLLALGKMIGARIIHISTDCVFSGAQGMYRETDFPDADDLYGRTKLLGELHDFGAITLRTSIIGRELSAANSLIGWFLAQTGTVNGYTKAIFSGLPTVELARVVRDYVLPNNELHGLYHVAAQPTNKYDLLQIVKQIYSKEITIVPAETVCIDRSLDATKFCDATGYAPPDWVALVTRMHEFN
jgi:dTDP-4-dehydrorhamnose reductase